MKKIALILSVLVLFFSWGAIAAYIEMDKSVKVQVTNTLDVKRVGVPVLLDVKKLSKAAKDFNPRCFAVYSGGREIPSQANDMDVNGELDEISTLVDLGPGEVLELDIKYDPDGTATVFYDKKTRAVVHHEYEGLSWESTLIAYRIYIDRRLGLDLFGKTSEGLALDKARLGNYHHLQSWGLDVLKVGESLGCGSFGIMGKGKFHKPDNWNARAPSADQVREEVRRFTNVLADGPVRSTVQMVFDSWLLMDDKLRVKVVYDIFAGKRWFTARVTILNPTRPHKVVTGIVKHPDAKLVEGDGYYYTWGKQTLPISDTNKSEDLGMGIIYDKKQFVAYNGDLLCFNANEEEGANNALILKVGKDDSVKYGVIAAWSRGDVGIKTGEEFEKEVKDAALEIGNPVKIKYLK